MTASGAVAAEPQAPVTSHFDDRIGYFFATKWAIFRRCAFRLWKSDRPTKNNQRRRPLVHVRLGLTLIGVLILAIGAGPAPNGAIIDYHRPPPTFGSVSEETHYLRGGLVRIDQRIVGARPNSISLRQQYTSPGQSFVFETIRTPNGRLVGVSAMDDPLSSPPPATLRRWTGPVETHLGEQCRVWQVTRSLEPTSSFLQSGCATADGLELWRKQASIDAIFATRIRRTTVPPETVRLPIETLDTTALIRAGAGSDHQHDYEVELQGLGGESAVYRRSGDWSYAEENTPRAIFIDIRNTSTGVVISYSRSQNGTRRLGWSRPPANETRITALDNTPLTDAPTQTILGERCAMRDLMAGAQDVGRVDCLTADGIPLLSNRWSRGSQSTLNAIRLSRRPQPLATVMLPRALARPASWRPR
jgi:hypothetical protein